jgi:hypothetical protein
MIKALACLEKAQKELALAQEEFQNENNEVAKIRDWAIKLAVAVGMSENRANLYNAKLTIEKKVQRAVALETDLEVWAKTLGYGSFAQARMGIGARTNSHDVVVAQLPVAYQKMPIKLALNKTNVELGRIERTLRRAQNELLTAFEVGVDEENAAIIAKKWLDLETLADLEKFYTKLIAFNNDYEEPEPPATVPTSELAYRLEKADKFSVVFTTDLAGIIQEKPVEIDRVESLYRLNDNPNKLVEFLLWQQLAPQMDELFFLRHLEDFAIYLEEKGLAVPQGKTLDNKTVAAATHRYDWEWADCVCLNDLLDYFAINGIEIADLGKAETNEETEEELLACLV